MPRRGPRAGASRGAGAAAAAAGSPLGALGKLQGSAAGESAACFLNREPQCWTWNTGEAGKQAKGGFNYGGPCFAVCELGEIGQDGDVVFC